MINKNKIVLLSILSVALAIGVGSVVRANTNKYKSFNHLELEVKEAFSQWSLEHRRLYSSADEHSLRYSTFKGNYLFIKETNEQNRAFTLELNESADLTAGEFAVKYGLTHQEISEEVVQETDSEEVVQETDSEQVAEGSVYAVNWQDLGKANSSKNLGTCTGSGTILSAVSVFESTQSVYYNAPVKKYSSQIIVDCLKTGCNKTSITDVVKRLYNVGVPLESAYPWTGKKGTCQKGKPLVSLTDYFGKQHNTSQDLVNWVGHAPVLTWISINPIVRFYSNGILTPGKGECDKTHPGVYVAVDGFSVDSKGNGHFLLKFPWGTSWGEKGNIRFNKKNLAKYNSSDTCGIYDIYYVFEK